MALQKASFRCMNYQKWMLRSFIAGLRDAPIARQSPLSSQYRPLTSVPYRRDQSRTTTFRNGHNSLDDLNDVFASKRSQTLDESTQSTSTPEQSAKETQEYIPWYLQSQHQPSTPFVSPLTARQELPELPSNPPSVLQPLLEQISTDLGMDDLTILDLRALDPPPALGANLLMIVGTARSEKHLHVSADRLCRWLRSTYSLHPYADGLLGRNELKLKMRRRAKRSRLFSAVGAKATGEADLEEGLRTGWVCVNVGRVDGGELPVDEQKLQRAEGIVGFGARSEGCNIVVQMLTEEKREEMDLEKLWEGIMGRAARDNAGEEHQSSTEMSVDGDAGAHSTARSTLVDGDSTRQQELRS